MKTKNGRLSNKPRIMNGGPPVKSRIELKVNGKTHAFDVEPSTTLLDVIRNELELTGAKEGCGLGDCGACTVIMDGRTVNSCLTLAVEAQGSEILTIEGLGHRGRIGPPSGCLR